MDRERFDALTRLLATRETRRAALGAALGAALFGAGMETGAKRRRRKKRADRARRRNQARAEQIPTTCCRGRNCRPGAGKIWPGAATRGSNWREGTFAGPIWAGPTSPGRTCPAPDFRAPIWATLVWSVPTSARPGSAAPIWAEPSPAAREPATGSTIPAVATIRGAARRAWRSGPRAAIWVGSAAAAASAAAWAMASVSARANAAATRNAPAAVCASAAGASASAPVRRPAMQAGGANRPAPAARRQVASWCVSDQTRSPVRARPTRNAPSASVIPRCAC